MMEPGKAKIMVVDDEQNIVTVLEERLLFKGFDVVTASDGEKAVKLLKEVKPDLILLDILMPGKDGFEICRMIKANPETRDIPIILLTAMSDTNSKIIGLESGADDFLAKPFEQSELIARVRAHLRVKNLFEEIKSISYLKDSLYQFVVHDLRNPLTSMKGWLSVLQMKTSGSLTEEQQKILQTIASTCNLQLQLVESLLDATLLEENRLKLSKEKIDVKELIRSCIEEIKVNSRDTVFSIDVSHTEQIYADKVILKRILLNLLGNSVKFTAGKGKIVVSSVHEKQKNQFVLSVEDTGPGIPKEYIDKVFDKYAQVEGQNEAEKRQAKGRGLGLTFCRLAVEAHGGKIHAENNPEKGIKMIFTLPAE